MTSGPYASRQATRAGAGDDEALVTTALFRDATVCRKRDRTPRARGVPDEVGCTQVAVQVSPGIEPMIKNFEAAAAGCAVFADWNPDLEELGFVDGETAIFYRSLDDLGERTPRRAPHLDASGSRARRRDQRCLDLMRSQ